MAGIVTGSIGLAGSGVIVVLALGLYASFKHRDWL